MEPIIEVRDLKKTFCRSGRAALTAVDGVSFKLFPGEILGIVGESGSGKSTLAKVIVRLVDVTEGSIIFDGEDITKTKGKTLRKTYRKGQMVFQTPVGSFDPRRTLGDGISESLINSGVSRAEAENRTVELLGQCGLPAEYAKRYPHEVSGGQCQRAAIARALAIRPKVLICDEATSALDVTVQKQILELLRELKESAGLSYIFICHNLALVQEFCTRLIVLHEGRIVEEGAPNEVIMHPTSDYTKQLIDSVL